MVSVRSIARLIEEHVSEFGHSNHAKHRELFLPRLRRALVSVDKSTLGCYHSDHFADAYKSHSASDCSNAKSERQSPVVWSHVCEVKDAFAIDVFRMYAGTHMAIHSHPRMFVVNLMLSGRLRYSRFHLQQSSQNLSKVGDLRYSVTAQCIQWNALTMAAEMEDCTAERSGDGEKEEDIIGSVVLDESTKGRPQLSEIEPEFGNLHELYAESDCSVLSVLLPGYDSQRQCTWFQPVAANGSDIVRQPMDDQITVGHCVKLRQLSTAPLESSHFLGDIIVPFDGHPIV